ncbi:MAG: HD domain-containing protein, partial [Nitrospirae bacterium]|nr:HD domain-containing protein [Nitrospirota bacterium]
ASEIYGEDKVCTVGNWNTLLLKQALLDACRIMGGDMLVVGSVTKTLDAPEFDKMKFEDLCEKNSDFKHYNELKETLFEIDRNVFTKGSKIDFELTRKMGLEIETIAPYEDTEIEIDENIMSAKNELLIRRKDIEKYRKYLEKIFNQRKNDEESINFNSTIVRENSKIAIKEIFDDPRNSHTIDKSSKIVLQILNGILDNSLAVSSLLSVNKFDYYLYTHSVNVCVLSIGIALNLGIKDTAALFQLAMGALLHDIGKSTISSDILNRPTSRLSELELSIFKQHVSESENLLRLFADVPEGVFPAITEHHEKLSGKGYPRGLKENELHISGKIVALVNYYDDLTTERPYKKIVKPYEALSMIQEQSDHYDKRIFSELIKLLGRT